MRIVAPEHASELADRLIAAFGVDRVSLEQGLVRVLDASYGAVILVLRAVERWLDEDAVPSAELWLGDNSYTLARSTPVESWQ